MNKETIMQLSPLWIVWNYNIGADADNILRDEKTLEVWYWSFQKKVMKKYLAGAATSKNVTEVFIR